MTANMIYIVALGVGYPQKGQVRYFNVGIYASINVCFKDIGS